MQVSYSVKQQLRTSVWFITEPYGNVSSLKSVHLPGLFDWLIRHSTDPPTAVLVQTHSFPIQYISVLSSEPVPTGTFCSTLNINPGTYVTLKSLHSNTCSKKRSLNFSKYANSFLWFLTIKMQILKMFRKICALNIRSVHLQGFVLSLCETSLMN